MKPRFFALPRLTPLPLVLAAGLLLGGCATTARNPHDPLEGFNRAMFGFNEGLDAMVIRPVAKGYETVVPQVARTGVSNFFGNVGDVWISVNNLLQGKPLDAAGDVGRVLINSTVGLLGFFDVATEVGLEKHDEDFGQTLGRWGVGSGPYLVLPVIGPRTVRDGFGWAFDTAADPVVRLDNVPTRNSLYTLRVVDTRAGLLPIDKTIEEAALDKYAYVRDAYLQRRRNLIFDGRPPRELDDEVRLDCPAVDALTLNTESAVSRLVMLSVKDESALFAIEPASDSTDSIQ